MFAATIVISVLLAVLLVLSAFIKLTRRQPFVQGYLRVGVPEDKLRYLAMILLAGAAGLIIGLWWPPVGIAAAAGLLCYFAAAVTAHLRASDGQNTPTPVTFAVLAGAALVLRLATL